MILELNLEAGAIASRAPQPTRPQRLYRALGAGQIVDDRGGVLRRYRSLVGVDHLIHDLVPNLPRQRGLIQHVIGRMTGEAVAVHRIRSRAVRKCH